MMLLLFFIMMIAFIAFIKPKKKTSVLGITLCNAAPQFNQNQFRQTATVGMLDLITNPNPAVMDVKYDPEATSTLTVVPGEGLKLIDNGATDPKTSLPIVDKRAADSDAIFGVKTFSTKENEDGPDENFSIAMEGAVIFMNAGAAITRGAPVALVQATPGNIVTRTTEEIFGIALDKAAAADELIRVKITARGFAELPLYELST